MKLFISLFVMIYLLLLTSISIAKDNEVNMSVVDSVDVNRYLGKWYEIARFDHKFEKDLICVTATYTLKKDGKIEVLNEGYKKDNKSKKKSAKGTAWIPNPSETAKLKVSFFRPFSGKYYIIELDKENYQYSMVTSGKNYLWILSRTPQLDSNIYEMLVKSAKDRGFEVEKLYKVPQDCQ